MAHWLKAAEDLFEVVDRRAKSVVTDLSDEQSNFNSPASAGQGSHGKRRKSKSKAQKGKSKNSSPTNTDTTKEKGDTPEAPADHVVENDGSAFTPTNQPIKDNVEAFNGEPVKENALDMHKENPSPDNKGIEGSTEDKPTNAEQVIKIENSDSDVNMDQERTKSVANDKSSNRSGDTIIQDADIKAESFVNRSTQENHKTDISPKKLQDQLDQAQGLLKAAKSTGQSNEARLARVCAGLSSSLQEYKSGNAELEKLLSAERELNKSFEVRIEQLQKDLSQNKREVAKVESNMAEALAAKNSEIEALLSSIDAVKKQAALSEENIASLQANMESMMKNRDQIETRMMQALREELAFAERRAEEEHAAHNATKMAFMEKEVKLEQRAIEAATALARIQRIADERTLKATELEQKVVLLEVECAFLNQELQDIGDRVRREQKKSPEEANQVIQAWQEETERAYRSQREAENKISSIEAELQKMRVEMAAMKRDAEHYSRQEHVELEKRYRELTDLLYYKQTQLEAMSSEKAAAEFQLQKEYKRLQEAQAETEKNRISRRPSSSWEEDTEMKTLEPLPLHNRHLVGTSIQLQKAVKLLDSGAVRATRFLWRYPTARVGLFFYLVFVHLFLMYLLHCLQEQAHNLDVREVAKSLGLSDPNYHD
ncbi:golgin candidate 1-like isoform X2 [Arachis duranensis]|uniref:Golgin candidate 1-like isoform X2 n=1 Tax=Arachis duranensis TaxID=130453 RepID=A0A6P5NF98_ARADU|nr:golgin candidate 1-like isoform X2 [Arachis duranensis]